jgi:hypothetical protein
MRISGVLLFAACLLTVACGDDDSPTAPSRAPLVFTSILSAANEIPAVTNAESVARGAVQVSLDVTRGASDAITAATATFYMQVTGLPASTTFVGAHIHPGAAGTTGPVIVSTGLGATTALTRTGDTVEYVARGITVDPAIAQSIINNPSGFYFNVHTVSNAPGVARGQLTRIR